MTNMKTRYRLFLRRKSVYYAFDNSTRKFQSLDTRNRDEAERLLHSLNEASREFGKPPRLQCTPARDDEMWMLAHSFSHLAPVINAVLVRVNKALKPTMPVRQEPQTDCRADTHQDDKLVPLESRASRRRERSV